MVSPRDQPDPLPPMASPAQRDAVDRALDPDAESYATYCSYGDPPAAQVPPLERTA
jgi:hypothetical protein